MLMGKITLNYDFFEFFNDKKYNFRHIYRKIHDNLNLIED